MYKQMSYTTDWLVEPFSFYLESSLDFFHYIQEPGWLSELGSWIT